MTRSDVISPTVGQGAPRRPAFISVSVVIELDNLAHAELDRPKKLLAELESQAGALQSQDAQAPMRLSGPLDLVATYDCTKADENDIRRALGDLVKGSASLNVRVLPVSGVYCKQKNAGAAITTGDIIVFLDCDVIPEPNWLASFLQAFSDPRVSVAVGNTYVDTSRGDAYSRSMALTWMFPLRDPRGGLTQTHWFYANNVAFRRETFLSRQFPDTPGLKHIPAMLLVERLTRDGIPLWHVGDARGAHPAPNGPVHFVKRAVSAGRAQAFKERSVTGSTMVRWIRDYVTALAYGAKRIVLEGFKVGMRWWQVPAAIGYALAYATLMLTGAFVTVIAPELMRDRFQI